VKRGTPKEAVGRLNAAINKALEKPSVRDAFSSIGAEPVGGTPDQYGGLVREQVAHWKTVVTDAGIKVSQ